MQVPCLRGEEERVRQEDVGGRVCVEERSRHGLPREGDLPRELPEPREELRDDSRNDGRKVVETAVMI